MRAPAPGHSQPSPREILVLKPSSLGDVVHTLPAVARLKTHWPAAQLRWLINPEWAPLLAGNPQVDEAIIFPRHEFRGPRGLLRSLAWVQALRRRVRPDLTLDFQGLLRSALIAKACRRAGGRIVGLSDAREGACFFYDETADVRGKLHAVDRYLALVAVLGIDPVLPLEWPLPQGSPPTGFDPREPCILFHPFSRGAGKSLTPAEVAEFCRALAPRRIVLAGRSDAVFTPLPHTADFLNRTTLLELLWLLRRARFVVSVDSGPMHLAAALGAPLLAIHKWSDPRKVGPYHPEAWVWKDGALSRTKDLAHANLHQPTPSIAAIARFVANTP